MPAQPIICFGQQPCGFFPKRFLVAKILTARRLQAQIGGEIIFFYHDSDHDPRETKTTLRHRQSQKPLAYNFEFENKVQRKFSPLYLKRVPQDWHRKMTNALPNYVAAPLVDAFKHAPLSNVADFCLSVYQKMPAVNGLLLDGIRVVRSGNAAFRTAACDITEYFVDVPYENEIVRARYFPASDGAAPALKLHEGGPVYVDLPPPAGPFAKTQISPTRDSRLRWMQSVLHCTHYIAGGGEQQYLNKQEAPEITFVTRDHIEQLDEAFTEIPS